MVAGKGGSIFDEGNGLDEGAMELIDRRYVDFYLKIYESLPKTARLFWKYEDKERFIVEYAVAADMIKLLIETEPLDVFVRAYQSLKERRHSGNLTGLEDVLKFSVMGEIVGLCGGFEKINERIRDIEKGVDVREVVVRGSK